MKPGTKVIVKGKREGTVVGLVKDSKWYENSRKIISKIVVQLTKPKAWGAYFKKDVKPIKPVKKVVKKKK